MGLKNFFTAAIAGAGQFLFGNGVVFNGVDTYVSNVNASLTATSGISFWLEMNTDLTAFLFYNGTVQADNYIFMLNANGFRMVDKDALIVVWDLNMSLNEKDHILISQSEGNATVYKNGNLISTEVFAGIDYINIIGSRTDLQFLDGKMTEIAICDGYAPTAQDAIDLYNSGAGAVATEVLSNVERYYKTNEEDEATELVDETGNQNATLTNFSSPPAYFEPWV